MNVLNCVVRQILQYTGHYSVWVSENHRTHFELPKEVHVFLTEMNEHVSGCSLSSIWHTSATFYTVMMCTCVYGLALGVTCVVMTDTRWTKVKEQNIKYYLDRCSTVQYEWRLIRITQMTASEEFRLLHNPHICTCYSLSLLRMVFKLLIWFIYKIYTGIILLTCL